jgi:integrase
MGHVQKRGDGRYRARWLDPDNRERSKTFTRKSDAERHLVSVEGAKLAGAYVDGGSKITVVEYARQWAAARPHRATKAARTGSAIGKHIEGTPLGARRLSAVRASEVQAWVTDRSRVLAPSTVATMTGILRSVFSAAVADRLIAYSPAARLTLPWSQRPRIVPLTVAQVLELADAMPARARAMVITQAGLGLRIGELMALRVDDVVFLRHTVRVQDQLSVDGKARMDPKTPRSRRTVPLPAVVADGLAAHIAAFPPAADGLIFTTLHGLPWRREYYGQRTFKRAVREAGLPAGITTHDLRHHYASVLLAAGESVVAVAERLGDTPQEVLKTYGHMMPDSDGRTRRAIDDAWSNDGLQTASGIHRMS